MKGKDDRERMYFTVIDTLRLYKKKIAVESVSCHFLLNDILPMWMFLIYISAMMNVFGISENNPTKMF